MPTAKRKQRKGFSPKVRTLWHCSRLRAWRFTYDWSWWYPSGNRQRIWKLLPGAGYGQFRHKADSLIAKFKEAGGTVREIVLWAESPRLSPLWLSTSSSALSWAVNHYRDNAIAYKAFDKMPENWSWRTLDYDLHGVSVMLLRSMQNTRRS